MPNSVNEIFTFEEKRKGSLDKIRNYEKPYIINNVHLREKNVHSDTSIAIVLKRLHTFTTIH